MLPLKPATTYQEQLNILKGRNVDIDNQDQCIKVLESVSYYRIIAYFLPFKQGDDSYVPGTKFQRVYRIYEFDRKLRMALFTTIEEVEIYLRAKLAYFHAHKYGAEGYLDPANYSSRHMAEKFQDNFKREVSVNKRSAIVLHHNAHYGGHFPVWAAVELFSFGMLSRFYGDLKTPDQKQLAREIYGTVPKNVTSWLRCCTDLRNICAHYGRLYYRIFPATPASVSAQGQSINQLWGAVLALKSLYPNADRWNNCIVPQIAALIEEYGDDISLAHIGFPQEWEQELRK